MNHERLSGWDKVATPVAQEDWVNVRLAKLLAEQVDEYQRESGHGFTSRADVVAAAVRSFLETGKQLAWRQDLAAALQAVQLTAPRNVDDFIVALLRELDVAPGKPQPKGRERRLQPR